MYTGYKLLRFVLGSGECSNPSHSIAGVAVRGDSSEEVTGGVKTSGKMIGDEFSGKDTGNGEEPSDKVTREDIHEVSSGQVMTEKDVHEVSFGEVVTEEVIHEELRLLSSSLTFLSFLVSICS